MSNSGDTPSKPNRTHERKVNADNRLVTWPYEDDKIVVEEVEGEDGDYVRVWRVSDDEDDTQN